MHVLMILQKESQGRMDSGIPDKAAKTGFAALTGERGKAGWQGREGGKKRGKMPR
jgi:hypothetical protein